MIQNRKQVPASGLILLILVLVSAIALRDGFIGSGKSYWVLAFSLPLLLLAIINIQQKKHAILRNFPLIGNLRYLFESIRPEIRRYFFESDLDGKSFNKRQRSIVYERAKNERQTVAFGMQADPNARGFEWVAHSVYPIKLKEVELRVWIGNHLCQQPYHASIYFIGARKMNHVIIGSQIFFVLGSFTCCSRFVRGKDPVQRKKSGRLVIE